MFATFFYFVSPPVALAIDVAVMAVGGLAAWAWQRQRAMAQREQLVRAETAAVHARHATAELDAEDERLLVGAG